VCWRRVARANVNNPGRLEVVMLVEIWRDWNKGLAVSEVWTGEIGVGHDSEVAC
jgi:hypothetical protein